METVSRQTLSAPVKEGGLGVIDFESKGKALQLSLIVSVIDKPDAKVFCC